MAILGFTGAVGNIALDTHIVKSAESGDTRPGDEHARLASFTACAIGPVMGGLLVQEFGGQIALVYLFFLTPALVLFSARVPGLPTGPR